MDYCMAQTSLSHTYGNVTCFIAEYVKSLFPKDYFKTIHISSTIAYKQFSIFQNTKKEFLKKSKPMLIIRPRIELDDNSVFLYDTLMTTRTNDIYMETSFTNLQPFIYDKSKNIEVKFLLNRLKMYFDVTIITETQMEQINQAHFLKNRIRQNYSFFLHTCLESYVPRELFRIMGDDINIPLYDENKSVRPFLDYVNSNSAYPVTYKMKNSTGNDEFFRYYPVNIDTVFSGLSIDDGNKKGMVMDSCSLSFTISSEFNAAGLYYYFASNRRFFDKYLADLKVTNDDKLFPIYTLDISNVLRYGEGWNVVATPMYKVVTTGYPDVTDISSIMNNSIMHCIKYHIDNAIPISTFIAAEVYKDNVKLVENVDWSIDFINMTLTTNKCNQFSTYRLVIHTNTFYINRLLNEILDIDKES